VGNRKFKCEGLMVRGTELAMFIGMLLGTIIGIGASWDTILSFFK
jgi:hypothetical protein